MTLLVHLSDLHMKDIHNRDILLERVPSLVAATLNTLVLAFDGECISLSFVDHHQVDSTPFPDNALPNINLPAELQPPLPKGPRNARRNEVCMLISCHPNDFQYEP